MQQQFLQANISEALSKISFQDDTKIDIVYDKLESQVLQGRFKIKNGVGVGTRGQIFDVVQVDSQTGREVHSKTPLIVKIQKHDLISQNEIEVMLEVEKQASANSSKPHQSTPSIKAHGVFVLVDTSKMNEEDLTEASKTVSSSSGKEQLLEKDNCEVLSYVVMSKHGGDMEQLINSGKLQLNDE